MELSADRVPVLTIDGPSGAGKGAVSATVARALGWNVLDSGAVYRAVALAALERGVDSSDETGLVALARRLPLAFRAGGDGIDVLLDGREIGNALRTEAVSVMASRVASLGPVRDALLALQRDCRKSPGLVADGRDMGTVVFPDAPLKVFLDASVEERAERRYQQLKGQGESVDRAAVLAALRARDERDRNRPVAPLRPAADAVIIDSSELSIDAVLGLVLEAAAAAGLR